jgi:sporulation protein YlmC with PRC-barrel domain
MKPDGPIKLVSQLLDLPIVDSDGRYCGIVDDVELAGKAKESLKVEALLVGPGAYSGRLPRWVMMLVRMSVGGHIARVPWSKVRTVGATVQLAVPGRKLELLESENHVERWIPHKGAL